jgi:hypothetical protein
MKTLERIRAATELLESIAADWGVLDQLPPDDRQRFHQAIAAMYNPDPVARRKRVKAVERERKSRAALREDSVLHETGIRTLRRQPVFTTPNVFPRDRFLLRQVERLGATLAQILEDRLRVGILCVVAHQRPALARSQAQHGAAHQRGRGVASQLRCCVGRPRGWCGRRPRGPTRWC